MKLSRFIDRAFDLATIYLRRSPAGGLIASGVTLLTAGPMVVANINFRTTSDDGSYISGTIRTADPEWWATFFCVTAGIILIAAGLYIIFNTYRDQQRKLLVAIELRGLSQTADTTVQSAIPSLAVGRRESIFIDVRQMVQGTAKQKQEAVTSINLIPSRLKQIKDGRDREDLSVYAGGLAPVPLLFLAGNLIAAESEIHWLDWDRKTARWVSPKEGTDLPDLLPINYEEKYEEVALAFSVSYPINSVELKKAFPDIKVLDLKLENPVPGLVISENSIQRLTQDFMSCIAKLQGKGTSRIHLILAAPSVLSFRLGSCYAGRNMPELIIYQYQQAQKETPYPWGIRMPNSEESDGRLVIQSAS